MKDLEIKSVVESTEGKRKKILILFSAVLVILLLISISLVLLEYKKRQDLAKTQGSITVETEGPIYVKTDLNTGEKITVYQGKIVEINKDTRTIKLESGGKTTELSLPINVRLIRSSRQASLGDTKDLASNTSVSDVTPIDEILAQPDLKEGVEISFTTGFNIPVPSLTIFTD